MIEIISIIYRILFWLTEFYGLYYLLLFLVGLFFRKQKYPMAEDKEKFCIFVPCHNEGSVIAATVKNYAAINYDKNLYDIYFLADNCSDNTAEEIRKAIEEVGSENFHILERNVNDPNKRGKPHALRWGIEQLEKGEGFYNKYDMFMILDADNFVDADILKHINSQYLSYKENKRPTMIQTYLDCKNKKGLIAKGYFVTYRVMNGFWQFSKQKLHLVPGIGGTGFAVTTEFLQSIGGFNCHSLTEDLEIQTKATIRNKTIAYNRNVRIYDEKPTGFKQAFVQRTRWAQGHWYLSFKFFPILFIQLFNFKTIKATFRKIDMMIYLTSRFFIFCTSVMFIMGIVFICFGINVLSVPRPLEIIGYISVVLGLSVIFISALYDGTEEEKKRVFKDFIPNIVSFYFYTFVDYITGLLGLLKCGNQKVWKKTAHKVTKMQTEKTAQPQCDALLPSNVIQTDKISEKHRTA